MNVRGVRGEGVRCDPVAQRTHAAVSRPEIRPPCPAQVRELLNETAPKLLEPISDTTCEGLSDGLVPGPGRCLPVKYGQVRWWCCAES